MEEKGSSMTDGGKYKFKDKMGECYFLMKSI